ncbi:ABC transporter substrate-binding protein [Pseudarthrobacter sp. NamE5]|uniref:ABC transporter substrate-binding protein n=1 Tax=Pseudarthrobacter sp. NamE5 TaxID=2576839 RepID=UPI00110AF38B|nr:ABC transporter substrate-binding protein [Pseudarthrobacter sp. NamE5]TLM82553.1 ABC transporter substrate-binding protein [Pseudarthrobacter sp. NamE5]
MSNPIDVGSVLGGRYKVTATVLASHDHDLVLDGVDQVLNRPVSILVAGPGNTEQVAQSAREVATGERPGTVQVLDLGMTEAATYLITNHTSAADLLDLVVASNPPYVEPFFTDTLGSEIFGQPRSHEPEPYDEEDHVEAGYINYGDRHPNQVDAYRSAPVVPPKPPVRPAAAPSSGRKPAGASAVGGAAAVGGAFGGAAAAGSGSGSGTAAADRSPLRGEGQAGRNGASVSGAPEGTPQAKPKVSLWSDDDYNYRDEQPSSTTPADNEPQTANKKSSLLARSAAPAAAAATGATGTSGASPADQDRYDGDDDEPGRREPRSMRWLVGGLLAVVLIVGLVIAVTNLGSLTSPGPEAAPTAPATNSSAPENTAAATQAPTSAAPPAVPPAIESISRQGTFDFAANFDRDLVRAYDGNAASYWSDMEFATENWGGLAPEGVPLVVKLENPAKISSVTLSQLGGSGGNITVYTNDRPVLDGAKSVGSNSFTSTELTMPLAEPVEAQYVIVAINSLPRLAAPKTRYGYGIRLAEVTVK